MVIDRLEVSYCEGWDPRARRAVGLLSSSRAAQRDRAGEQYALTLAKSGRPLAVIEVAWANVYCAVWFLDEQLRRVMQVDCRRLATDRLFVVRGRQWAYTEPDQAEFDENVTWGEFRLALDGTQATSVHRGSATPTANLRDMVIPENNRLDPPAFGGWAPLVRAFRGHLAALGHEISAATVFQDVSDPGGEGLPGGTAPWHPPWPRQPGPLDLLFRPGARLEVGLNGARAVPGFGGTVTVEVSQIGTLRMPSGALIACDPGYLREQPAEVVQTYDYRQSHHPFTETVPPGEYPVMLSRFRWLVGNGPRVAAAKVWVGDGRVASWEMALRPGEDPRTLRDNEYFGFGVDWGTGCFYDASSAAALAPLTGEFVLGGEMAAELTDEKSGANLIAFESGWGDGSYPVWIGRTAAGDIACFIADVAVFDTYRLHTRRRKTSPRMTTGTRNPKPPRL